MGAVISNLGHSLPGSRRRAVICSALLALAVLFYGWYGNRHHFFDLHIYYDALTWWADGRSLYDYARPDPVQGALYFTYTPLAAMVMWPMVLLPFGWVAVLFTVATVGLLAQTTYAIFRTALPSATRSSAWWLTAAAVPALLIIEPIRENLTLGQINLVLIAMIMFDFCYALSRHRWYAGVGIGLAAAIKLIPAIFIVYLAVTRRWRAFGVAVASAAVATLLAAVIAPRESRFYWTSALWDSDRVGQAFYTGNQSIKGLLARLVAPAPPSTVLWAALVAVVTVAGLYRAVKAHRAGHDLVGVTLVGLTSGLVSPITWPHHIYWFIPAMILLLLHARGWPARRRFVLWGALAALYAALVWGTVSFLVWTGAEATPAVTPHDFLLRNLLVLCSLVLLVTLPADPDRAAVTAEQQDLTVS
ncbi:alpha-1,2-mannosyltransferase [Actinoplanes octamycinicus]|uniref:Alpha-1,2-mannosyltransferase n=1 Tax=Actinoplanes octamycinicus TaxID=135948 RepID=A0A7W7GTL7_9ACTN|nr:glycosyltransferase 87 family protein [Actinoplanes octamycinicus]MBB4738089.1 alpha-1,2-mannosyltransferase [Actinoplanes octamycinicus]GIE59358.1 membrane protein [Actinoplanes octamycinicus]